MSDDKKVWLKATVEVVAINEESQKVSITLYTKWYYEPNDDDLKKRIINYEKSRNESTSHPQTGIEVRSTSRNESRNESRKLIEDDILDKLSPINKSNPVENILQSELIDKLQRVNWEVKKIDGGEKSVFILTQIVWKITLQVVFNFKRFPIDVQEIPLRFILREDWELCQDRPAWIVNKEELNKGNGIFRLYKGDEYILTVKSTKLSQQHLQWQNPSIDVKKKTKPLFVIRYKRVTTFYVFNVIVPIFTILTVSLVSLLLDRNSSNFRFNNLTTGLLQMVVFLQYTNSLSPDKGAVTFSSGYVLLSFFFYLLATIKVIVVNYIISKDAAGLFSFINTSSTEEICEDFLEESISCVKNMAFAATFDDVTTWVLIGAWIISNCLVVAMIILDSRRAKARFPNLNEEQIEAFETIHS